MPKPSLPIGLVTDLQEVRKLLLPLPQRDDGEPWSVHALCRWIVPMLNAMPWYVQDGTFGDVAVGHTWLGCGYGSGTFILDIQPIDGASGPLLVFATRYNSWNGIYSPHAILNRAEEDAVMAQVEELRRLHE